MADREKLYSGLSDGAWGYFFITFDFNFGTVSILPRFAGYLLLLSAIRTLSGERRDLPLLRPLCMLLAVWNGVVWLFSWAGVEPGGMFPALSLIIAVAGLYFHFQFLTDMAALAEACQPEGENLNRRLLNRRTAYTVLNTAADVILYVPTERYEDERAAVVAALAVGLLAAAVLVMLALFQLRRLFREEETELPGG